MPKNGRGYVSLTIARAEYTGFHETVFWWRWRRRNHPLLGMRRENQKTLGDGTCEEIYEIFLWMVNICREYGWYLSHTHDEIEIKKPDRYELRFSRCSSCNPCFVCEPLELYTKLDYFWRCLPSVCLTMGHM